MKKLLFALLSLFLFPVASAQWEMSAYQTARAAETEAEALVAYYETGVAERQQIVWSAEDRLRYLTNLSFDEGDIPDLDQHHRDVADAEFTLHGARGRLQDAQGLLAEARKGLAAATAAVDAAWRRLHRNIDQGMVDGLIAQIQFGQDATALLADHCRRNPTNRVCKDPLVAGMQAQTN